MKDYIKLAGVYIFMVAVAGLGLFGLAKLFCISWMASEDVVSGIVYDATFDEIISGNTNFKIRASAEMYADKDTSATYCLPRGSQYEELIRKAAADKRIKVTVIAHKFFMVKNAIWDCPETIEVKELTNEAKE